MPRRVIITESLKDITVLSSRPTSPRKVLKTGGDSGNDTRSQIDQPSSSGVSTNSETVQIPVEVYSNVEQTDMMEIPSTSTSSSKDLVQEKLVHESICDHDQSKEEKKETDDTGTSEDRDILNSDKESDVDDVGQPTVTNDDNVDTATAPLEEIPARRSLTRLRKPVSRLHTEMSLSASLTTTTRRTFTKAREKVRKHVQSDSSSSEDEEKYAKDSDSDPEWTETAESSTSPPKKKNFIRRTRRMNTAAAAPKNDTKSKRKPVRKHVSSESESEPESKPEFEPNHEPKSEPAYLWPCPACGHVYDTEKATQNHIRSMKMEEYSQPRKLPCIVCGKYFSSEWDVKDHLFKGSCLPNAKTVLCTFCKKSLGLNDAPRHTYDHEEHTSAPHTRLRDDVVLERQARSDNMVSNPEMESCNVGQTLADVSSGTVLSQPAQVKPDKDDETVQPQQSSSGDRMFRKRMFPSKRRAVNIILPPRRRVQVVDHDSVTLPKKRGRPRKYTPSPLKGMKMETTSTVFDDEDDPHKKRFVCKTCGVAFRQSSSLRVHELRHIFASEIKSMKTEPKPTFRCDACGLLLPREDVLVEHRYNHHLPDFIIPCEFCIERFRTEADLTHHRNKTHADKLPHVCSLCDRRFETEIEAETCELLHDRSNFKYVYPCDRCNPMKCFGEEAKFLSHMATSHPKDKLRCIEGKYSLIGFRSEKQIQIDRDSGITK